jgi:catechol 2,3-dioxygenase-like lactoylglutathione lyase family enzyme
VVIIYKGDRLTQYEQWKADQEASDTADPSASKALARRLGRLLGYSPQGINNLLMKNTDYRTFASFGVTRQVTHLYYEKPEAALAFYEQTLGLPQIGKTRFQIGADAYIEIQPSDGDHPIDQPKSTAIALLTDQLPGWYAHVQAENIAVKYTYKPREGGPHDGFVAIDPGGYLLEFEQFKQHPENELFMAILDAAPRISTEVQNLNFYGSITWTYHKDLLAMQQFYEEVLGYRLVADQGWTKIYQTSPTGFIGLVDERRGMQDYADQKAVEIEWGLLDEAGFVTYAGAFWKDLGYEDRRLKGPEGYRYIFRSNEK